MTRRRSGLEAPEQAPDRVAEVLRSLDRHPDAEAVPAFDRDALARDRDLLGLLLAPLAVRATSRCRSCRSSPLRHLLLGDELGLDDLLVRGAALDQLGVGAEPDEASLLEHEDLVGAHDGRDALGDDDGHRVT